MEQLAHLIYVSAATQSMEEAALMKLLANARENNQRLNVTGMLLYSEGTFFQVLEGDQSVIEDLFASISGDTRHQHVTKIIHEPIVSRVFGNWSMGYSGLTPKQVATIDGLSDFFINPSYLVNMDHGRARKLLQAFSEGRWRQTLN